MDKRYFSHFFISACIACFTTPSFLSGAQIEPVPLVWLDGEEPPNPSGISWGVPWSHGTVQKTQSFTLTSSDGRNLPIQTWPLAYWSDGSLKWSGFSTVADSNITGPLKLSFGSSTIPDGTSTVQITENNNTIEINTGQIQCRIPRQGAFLIDSITINGLAVAEKGHLVCILQHGRNEDVYQTQQVEKFVSSIKKVTVEQSGPVRAVVKLEGMHKSESQSREWLPFYVRLYFYAGQTPIRMVHSIVFDGDEKQDFIRGLGVVFSVPMREQIQNRHVRFSGEDNGLWSEPIQPLIGRDGRFIARPFNSAAQPNQVRGRQSQGVDVYPDQINGKRVPNKEELDSRGQNLLEKWAVWDDFRLLQPNADGFTIEKRTNPDSCWLPSGAGHRASGLVFAGDVSGGLAAGLKDFWQSYPSSLEVRRASSESAELRVWMWSPDAPAMDLRHYDTIAHGLEEVYEDVQEGLSTPNGIARTNELTLFPTVGVPSKEETAAYSKIAGQPPLLVCTPKYLNSVQAFGIWGLEDRSTPVKRQIEERLDATLATYLKAAEQYNWYGFWDYGDVMHSYDQLRHVWRYDLGGMAWDNSELGTDMWLWYSFLRTGRADIFRMAEAMTRHTGEVDCYHQGRLAGLGSRHNVRHWGCGAKEARISQAPYRRFYYYMTTDERTGDIMREMLQADERLVEFDPMRLAQPIAEAEKKYPTRLRLGPDWFALAGNWMTEWERTGDTKWRDKIYAGMDCICKMPLGLRTGRNLVMGFDPKTGNLYQLSDEAGVYNLATIMGGAEVIFELNMMIDHEGWQKAWLQYCRLYNAPKELLIKDMTTGQEGADASYARDGRLAAYVYQKTGNEAFMRQAVNSLMRGPGGGRENTAIRRIEGPDVLNDIEEGIGMNTNNAAQNGLTTITVLGMVGDHLPEQPTR
ncbi:MAG: hypothetical protein JW787_07415 [Sedimentisphaerales bacterium]|nr:hypothetical protein [Sedimentisphaerales bacterium]